MNIPEQIAVIRLPIKKITLFVLGGSSLVATGAFAGEVDPRLDGRWVGSETFQFGASGYSGSGTTNSSSAMNTGRSVSRSLSQQTQTEAAIIGIADHGKTIGVTKGFAKGAYEVVPQKSGGNTLAFQMPGTKGDKLIFVGRQHCTLTLSADGNTLKETGIAILAVTKSGHGTTGQVWGTFKRQGSY